MKDVCMFNWPKDELRLIYLKICTISSKMDERMVFSGSCFI